MNCASLFSTNKTAFLIHRDTRDATSQWITGDAYYQASRHFDAVLRQWPQGSKVYVIGPTDDCLLQLYLAVWRQGDILVPIDHTVSAERLSQYCMTLAPDAMISVGKISESINTLITAMDVPHIHIENVSSIGSENPPLVADIDFDHECSVEDALVVFTSGSTGTPKGVLLTHQQLQYGAEQIVQHNQLEHDDVGLGLLPLNHINGIVTTLLAPALSQSRVILYSGSFDVTHFLTLLEDFPVSWISGVPFHYNRLVKADIHRQAFQQVRFCRSASAPLTQMVIEQFEALTDTPLIETLGMSEAAGQIFANPLPPGIRQAGTVGIPVGFAADICDAQGQILPDDQEGEIVISGPGLFKGYYHHHQLQLRDQARFATGDLAVRTADGYYQITGRVKDMALFCGETIALNPIEKALSDVSFIDEVAAKVCQDQQFGERIDLYLVTPYVLTADQLSELKHLIAQLMPSLCMLRHTYRMRALPRSNVGKLLKGLLTSEHALETLSLVTPSDDLLEQLQQLLNTHQLSDTDQMGQTPGWDSLVQTVVIASLEDHLARSLSATELRLSQHVAGLKQLLSHQKTEDLIENTLSQSHSIPSHSKQPQSMKAINTYIDQLIELGLNDTGIYYLIISAQALQASGVEDISRLIETLLTRFNQAAFVMNTFSWQFCRGLAYDARWTPCETGLLNEVFRRYPGVQRTHHPIYSFATYGIDQQTIEAYQDVSSWGAQSFLAYLCAQPNVRVIAQGAGFLLGNPAIHYVEQLCAVPYRFHKSFTGKARFAAQNRVSSYTASMFVRHIGEGEYHNDWSALGRSMQNQQCFLGDIQQIPFYSYQLSDLIQHAHVLMTDDPYALAVRA